MIDIKSAKAQNALVFFVFSKFAFRLAYRKKRLLY
jgi:hypothetical protein